MLNQTRFIDHDDVDAEVLAFVMEASGLEASAAIHAMFLAEEPTVYRQLHKPGVEVIGPWFCDEQTKGKIYQLLFDAAERHQRGGE